MTSILHYNELIIGLFAFLPLEAAFHKFRIFLMITFDSIARLRLNFFQIVYNHKAHPPKMLLSMQIVSVVRHKQKTQIWGKWGQKTTLMKDLSVIFSKIVLKYLK